MASRLLLLIQYLIVFLSYGECFLPINNRHWSRNKIGVFLPKIILGGFLCYNCDSFGLQHHQEHDHIFNFSNLIKDSQTQIWDPGDSIYKIEVDGIRLWIGHIKESRLMVVSENGHINGSRPMVVSEIAFLIPPFSMRLIIPYIIGAIILSLLILISFCIKEKLLKFKTRDINLGFDDVIVLFQSDQIGSHVHGYIVCVMELWVPQFDHCWVEMSSFYVVWVKYWRQDMIGIEQICWTRDILVMIRWESINTRGSGTWFDTIKLHMVLLKRITETSKCSSKTVVRRFWCHSVYITELVLGTLGLPLRFVKRSVSQKLLHTIRNKEKSNMKLDNNRLEDLLASKATLRKASSKSILLYFS